MYGECIQSAVTMHVSSFISFAESGNHRPRKLGFSLLELILVISVMSLMVAFSGPLISSVVLEQGMNKSVYDLRSVLQQAKSYAMAQDTYVWVGLFETDENGYPSVVVSVVGGKSGSVNDLTANNVQPLLKLATLRGIQLNKSDYLDLPGVQATDNVDIMNSEYAFSQSIPGKGTPLSSAGVVVFDPRGGATVKNAQMTRYIGIGLKSGKGNGDNNKVAIQVSGLNGEAIVYRQ